MEEKGNPRVEGAGPNQETSPLQMGMSQNKTTRGPHVLVFGSIYQGNPFWGYPILTHSQIEFEGRSRTFLPLFSVFRICTKPLKPLAILREDPHGDPRQGPVPRVTSICLRESISLLDIFFFIFSRGLQQMEAIVPRDFRLP